MLLIVVVIVAFVNDAHFVFVTATVTDIKIGTAVVFSC